MEHKVFSKTFEYTNENAQTSYYFTETKIVDDQNLEIVTKTPSGFNELIKVTKDDGDIFLSLRGKEIKFHSPISKILRPYSQEIFDEIKKDSN